MDYALERQQKIKRLCEMLELSIEQYKILLNDLLEKQESDKYLIMCDNRMYWILSDIIKIRQSIIDYLLSNNYNK